MPTLYKIASPLLRFILGKQIGNKNLKNSTHVLYYEKSQHLGFFFNSKINYEPEIKNAIVNLVEKNDTVFDIGANIGQYSLFFASVVGKNGKVISMEPDTRNFAFLNFNMIINNCKNVICKNLAVSEKNGELKFYKDSKTGGRKGSIFKKYVGDSFEGDCEMVRTIMLEKLVSLYGLPSFIKIDVEGAESLITKSIDLNTMRIPFLIEIRKETKSKVFDDFNSKNFSTYIVDSGKQIKISNESEIPNFANLLFIPN